jgi:hypothetical protein
MIYAVASLVKTILSVASSQLVFIILGSFVALYAIFNNSQDSLLGVGYVKFGVSSKLQTLLAQAVNVKLRP